jgi:hypothetical protein
MKSFKEYITEQESLTISPADSKVITAFFRGVPDVSGDTIKTAQSDLGDFTAHDMRIDLLNDESNGYATAGLVLNQNGVVSLANQGKMIDRTPMGALIQDRVRQMAKDKDVRFMG